MAIYRIEYYEEAVDKIDAEAMEPDYAFFEETEQGAIDALRKIELLNEKRKKIIPEEYV